MRPGPLTLVGALVVLAASAAVADDPFQNGDVFAGLDNGRIVRSSATGQRRGTLDASGGPMTGMCFDLDGNLYATDFGGTMRKYDRNGRLLDGGWGGPFSAHPESCVVDAAGNVYTGEVDGESRIRKHDASGALIKSFRPRTDDRGVDWIDLAADQCTMFYTSEGSRVMRYDVCRDRQLDDFVADLAGSCYALRVRENGEVMVACRRQVYRLSSTGRTLDTYPIADERLFAMNLDPDGKHFWTGGILSGRVYRVDIASGSGTTRPVFDVSGASGKKRSFLGGLLRRDELMGGLAVYGERTAALAKVDAGQEQAQAEAARQEAARLAAEQARRDEEARLAEEERRRQEAARLAEEERRRLDAEKKLRAGRVSFGPASPVELGEVAAGSSAESALGLDGTTVEGWGRVRVTTDLDVAGVVLEVMTDDGWKALGSQAVELPLDPDGTRRWAVRVRVGNCTAGVPAEASPRLRLEAPGPTGATTSLEVPLRLRVEASPWLRCFGEALVGVGGLIVLGIVIHGLVSPSRFGPRVGVVLSPEEDLGEGFFHPIRAQRGSGSGFYRDARIYVGRDYRLTSRAAGSLARLRATKTRVLIEPAGSLLRRTADGEWEPVPAEESWMRPGVTYRDEGGTVFFELTNR